MRNDNWTTERIGELKDKVFIVTGGNSGLGYESVKAFAEKGAHVILACRSPEKGELALRQIAKESPPVEKKIDVMQLDLQDFSSIEEFSKNFLKKHQRLDVLLNNAGIMTTPYFKTADGLEGQMGTNHFGHFRLTGLLLETLIKTPASRIVNVSSHAHTMGKIDFSNLLFENKKGYTPMKSYGRSKLCNLLFTYELDRKLKERGFDSLSVAAHPGGAQTNLDRYIKERLWARVLVPLVMKMGQSAAKGALPQIRASVDEQVKGGEYFGPHIWMIGSPVKIQSSEASHNREDAEKLWEVSEQITGVKFFKNRS